MIVLRHAGPRDRAGKPLLRQPALDLAAQRDELGQVDPGRQAHRLQQIGGILEDDIAGRARRVRAAAEAAE